MQLGAIWCNLVTFGATLCSLVQIGADCCNLGHFGASWFRLVQLGAVCVTTKMAGGELNTWRV